MSNLSNGNLERRVKGEFRARCKLQNKRCVHCNQPIDYSAPRNHPESFEADHRYPVSTHPHLGYDPGNLMPSHSRCNRTRQDKPYQPMDSWVPANWG